MQDNAEEGRSRAPLSGLLSGYQKDWFRFDAVAGLTTAAVVILECSAIPDFEYTALLALGAAEERLREHGIALWLCALNPGAYKVLKRSPLGQALGSQRMFLTLGDAVRAFERGAAAPHAPNSTPARL